VGGVEGLLRGVRLHSYAHYARGAGRRDRVAGESVHGWGKCARGRGSTKGGESLTVGGLMDVVLGEGKSHALHYCIALRPYPQIHLVVVVEDHRLHIRRICKCVRVIQQTYTDAIHRHHTVLQTQTQTETHIELYLYIYTHTCMYVRMYVCIYVCMSMYM
jgi:hypothetical protein